MKIYIFERLDRMHEDKKDFFVVLYFFFVLEKTKYFNTRFVSLQYKNTK
jgi:hypothetical protein